MSTPLWRPAKQTNVGLRIHSRKEPELTLRLWVNLEEERARQDAIRQAQQNQQRRQLLKQKTKLLEQRQQLAAVRVVLKDARAALISADNHKLLELLVSLLRNPQLAEFDSQALAAARFYLYQDNQLQDKMLEVAAAALQGLSLSEDTLALFYDIAITHEEAGDPAVAKQIYKRFIDGLYLNYRDVSQRYARLL